MMPDEDPATAQWRRLLTGEDPSLRKVRRIWRRVPAAPRCKVCASPFHGVGGAVARLFWHGPMRDNPLLCKACFGQPVEARRAAPRWRSASSSPTSAARPASRNEHPHPTSGA